MLADTQPATLADMQLDGWLAQQPVDTTPCPPFIPTDRELYAAASPASPPTRQ